MLKKGSYIYYALSNGLFYYAWGTFGAILSVYLAGIGCSATEVSLIASSAPLFAMITQPVCGIIADKLKSPKMVAIGCLLLSAISGLVFAYTHHYIFLFLFNGFAQGMIYGTVSLTDRLATASPYPFGTIRIWGSILYAIACQVTGIVYDYISPIAIYYIFAVSIVLTIIALMGTKDVKPKISHQNEKFNIKELAEALIKNKAFVMFVIIYILFQGPTTANTTYMPLLIQHLGGTTTMVGTTLLLSTLSEMPVVLFTDKIMKHISYKVLMIIACVISIIRFTWYSTCPDPSMIMYIFFFQGTTSIVFILVTVRIIMEIVDERFVNSAYGIANMLAKGVSALIFQMVSGTISDTIGGNQSFTVIYLMYTISLIFALIIACKFKMKKETIM